MPSVFLDALATGKTWDVSPEKSVASSFVQLLLLYFELVEFEMYSSNSVVNHMKSIFSRHGAPEVTCIDNRPQFNSSKRSLSRILAKDCLYSLRSLQPQWTDCFSERALKLVKGHWRKTDDLYKASLTCVCYPACMFSVSMYCLEHSSSNKHAAAQTILFW